MDGLARPLSSLSWTLLASGGTAKVLRDAGIPVIDVKRRLRVACFFTGNELREPGSELAAGQIYNSNRYTLNGFLQQGNPRIRAWLGGNIE